ncbi:transcriptional regulator with XRE-family HTH domain [Paraburkholderia sp. HC6.4b]|uniref:helix-turn-helix domain-containing protein n=1 Tax=unclassified Paraburkholderia TaxID=2615204 RepID=UPI0016153BE8|nr:MULTISPECIES: helix-turn-helix transcriptional regulator [unclassified Paraburkholderia]MBB5406548.1 transcriptional regulator with XRE-family HTH domain [Paraburkholderia sp. HC6.4b]MBB5448946.1 transcriptional regulator with XRE-family HTH domain [Paraburkholderia sp. Kb1A]
MNYGFDLSSCQFITDHEGKRLRVEMPIWLFDQFVELRNAALRAQATALEEKTPRGAYRSSLAGLTGVPDVAVSVDAPFRPTLPEPRTKRERAERLFLTPEERLMQEATRAVEFPTVSETSSGAPAVSCQEEPASLTPRRPAKQQVFFPRVFVEPIPDEVARLIEQGNYNLRAWRLYRDLTPVEAAELAGLSRGTVLWHERGYNVPSVETLKRFADVYDCTTGQLTPQPDSCTKPYQSVPAPKGHVAQFAPDDTEYPDAVMAHLIDGRSPITAWRMYRRMTIDQCAKAFGCTSKTFKGMEALPVLRERTRKTLALVLSCKPVQLLRPRGLEIENTSRPGASAHRTEHRAARNDSAHRAHL